MCVYKYITSLDCQPFIQKQNLKVMKNIFLLKMCMYISFTHLCCIKEVDPLFNGLVNYCLGHLFILSK